MDMQFGKRDEMEQNPWAKASAWGGGSVGPRPAQSNPFGQQANGNHEAAASAMGHFAEPPAPAGAGPSPELKAEGRMRINQVLQRLGAMLKENLARRFDPVLLQALDLADEAEHKYFLLVEANMLRSLYKHVNNKIVEDTENEKVKK